MAYDQRLAERIRKAVKGQRGVTERAMFGGIAFMRNGSMFCGVMKANPDSDLLVRVGAEGNDAALARPHTRPMDFTGRPMKGYIYVSPAGYAAQAPLRGWVKRGLDFVATLPPRRAAARKQSSKPKAKAKK